MDKYRDEIPTIGRLLEKKDGSVKVEWWHGSYSSVWSMCRQKVGKEYLPWTETIPTDAIIWNRVAFTKTKHLTKESIIALKQVYNFYLSKE